MNFGKLAKIIAEHIECDVEEIKVDSKFEDLGIDSLDTVEMVMELEEELGTELELNEKLATVGDLLAFIQKKVG
ncbi:acyl carrier protein [Sedimentibacter sp. zth1]|uniref:acyl carrier protein n=1 Tax=Sedimentibacter sp. zth1 TaxID=2816908 RepID=UPI001A914BD0|nr:acyl carrier protein [Sedimentibacter sp. zth1]QSX05543.1 acyl carrier protein [Sedimentibacter sp. zth1]